MPISRNLVDTRPVAPAPTSSPGLPGFPAPYWAGARTAALYLGDCVRHLAGMPAGTVDLAFADPPFNIGYEYDQYDDRRTGGEYLAWTEEWIAATRRVLKPTGSVYVAIGDRYAAEVKVRLDATGMTMRNWIIWHYGFGMYRADRFGACHTHVLYYTADPKRATFRADDVRERSARQAAGDARANPKGKIPGDVWTVSRVCGTFRERTGHPCQMPESILERIISASSNPGDVVLDPFLGSGTTAAVATRLGRTAVGIELSERYLTEYVIPRISGTSPGSGRNRDAGADAVPDDPPPAPEW